MGYELIQTTEVGSGGASSISFQNIPQDGIDLILKVSARENASGVAHVGFRINNNSTTTHKYITLYGNSGNAFRIANTSENLLRVTYGANASNSTSDTFSNLEARIPSYTGSQTKIGLFSNTSPTISGTPITSIVGATSPETGAVTRVDVIGVSANFLEHTSVSLYKTTAN